MLDFIPSEILLTWKTNPLLPTEMLQDSFNLYYYFFNWLCLSFIIAQTFLYLWKAKATLVVVCRLLTFVASFAAEHGF